MERGEIENLYNAHRKALFNFALRWVFDSEVANELVQETFVKLWQRKSTSNIQSPKSYLFRTLQNLAINHLRRKSLAEAFDFGPLLGFDKQKEECTEASAIQDEEFQKTKLALEKVPIRYRKVLLMAYFGEMTNKEIALSLALPEGTVASRKSRAIEYLKGEMIEEGVVYA